MIFYRVFLFHRTCAWPAKGTECGLGSRLGQTTSSQMPLRLRLPPDSHSTMTGTALAQQYILLFANGSGISEKLFCKWFPGFRTFISRKESRTENSPTAPRELPDSSRKLPDSSPKNSATTSGKHDDNPRQLSRNFPPNRVKESTNLCCLRFLANR